MEDAEKIMRRLATKCYEFTKQIQSQAKLIEMLGEAMKHACLRMSPDENTQWCNALSAYESWKQRKGE